MIRHHGGQEAGKGTYWNLANGERIDIEGTGMLPGDRKTTYYRLPASGILLLGPVVGLIYAVFLPFIGIAMACKLLLRKAFGNTLTTAQSTASFGWRPTEAYLAGKKKTGQPEEKGAKKGDDTAEKH